MELFQKTFDIVQSDMSYSYLFKLIIIGDSGVGKSCILLQFTSERYREKHQVTIGVEFGSKVLKHKGLTIKLQIWDTAGQQSFRSITRGYYKNAVGAVVCYDICNRESFNHMEKWIEQAKTYGPQELLFILVGNKVDQEKDRKVTVEEGLRLAKENKMPFLQTSAKKGINIDTIFTTLTQKIMERIELRSIDVLNHPGIKVGNENKIAQLVSQTQKEKQIKLESESKSKQKKKGCCKN